MRVFFLLLVIIYIAVGDPIIKTDNHLIPYINEYKRDHLSMEIQVLALDMHKQCVVV
jgi:hypothetical protein